MSLRSELKIAVLLCLVISLAPQTRAQSGRIRQPSEGDQAQILSGTGTVRLSVEEVSLTVGIRYDIGKLRPRIAPLDLFVVEGGKRRNVTSVIREPAHILLIIDTGGAASLHKNINLNREVAYKIIDSLRDEDQAAIIAYADGVSLIASWTSDKSALRDALSWKLPVGTTSELYNGLLFGVEEVLTKVTGRRSLVVLTDGVDSHEPHGYEKLLTAITRARATVYIVSYHGTIHGPVIREMGQYTQRFDKWQWRLLVGLVSPRILEDVGFAKAELDRLKWVENNVDARLNELAERSGGAKWNPSTWDEFKAIAERIIWEIGTEFRVSYATERDPDSEFHLIKVCPTRTDIVVRGPLAIYSTSLP